MLKKLNIRARLMASYVLIVVIAMTAGVTALFMLRSVGANLTSFYNNNYAVNVSTWTARRSQQAARADLLQAMLETDHQVAEQQIESAKQNLTMMRDTFPIIRSTFKGDVGLVDQIEDVLDEAVVYRDQIFELIESEKNDEAFQMLKSQYVPCLNQMSELLRQIADTAGTNAERMVEQGQSAVVLSTVIVCIIIAVSILLAIILGWVISNSIRRPVNEIEKAAKMISDGDMNAVITYRSKDELGRLSDSMRTTVQRLSSIIGDLTYLLKAIAAGNFNLHTKVEQDYVGDFYPMLLAVRQMNADLSSTMERISQAAGQVSAGSEQVSSGAQALSQGTTEQASAVEELAATMEGISKEAGQNAQTSEAVKQSIKEIGTKVEVSNRDMQEMMDAMKEISESSSQIGKVIKTIEDIAFQTNILALNAAVEAARAGAAGRGFAVVADEVRSLAAKSSEASKDTAALIEHSQNSVSHGTKIAEETAEGLHSVVEGTKDITAKVNQIAEASIKQADAAVQIAQGVEQISSVVQTNSATAEQSAAASEELSGQAEVLKNLVQQFTLLEKENGATTLPQTSEESGYSMAAPDKY